MSRWQRFPEVLTDGSVQLRCWSPGFAEALLIAIEESLAELEQWMDWAQEVPALGGLQEVLRRGELDFHETEVGTIQSLISSRMTSLEGSDCTGLRTPASSRSAIGCAPARPAEAWRLWPPEPLSALHRPAWTRQDRS